MSKLSTHFDSSEFRCNCGKEATMSELLIRRLEEMHEKMDAKAIYVTSGFRCPNCSVKVGGYRNDAHTKGMAADIKVQKQDGSYYTAEDIAEMAERIGFGGIGLMNGATHVDTRDTEPYSNNHWFGSEVTGNNNIATFQRGTVFPSRQVAAAPKSHKIKIYLDDKLLIEKEIDI